MIGIMWIILDGNVFCYTRREPVGVVGAIIPVGPILCSYSYQVVHKRTVCTV